MLIKSRAGISRSGSLDITYCFSKDFLNRVSFLLLGLLGGGAIATSGNSAWGQVVGDNTLGSESSLVTSPRAGAFQINGGATRGTNLFHSFNQFSVPTGGSAFFNNGQNIQNIITRVTGSSVSNIDGLIRANGTANLFLINPNGIIFGSNAKLNINGSFITSTANSVLFADGTQFSATDTRTQPLLTVNVPIGLQLGDNPASVKVQRSNLEVKPNQNLVLLGGDVSLYKGKLTAPGGRIELGGLSTAGTVGLNENGSLDFPNNVARSDVSVTNGASVNVRARGGGFITINSRNLEVSGGSKLTAGIGKNSGTSRGQAGDVEINASNTVSINGSKVENQVEENALGDAGNITITTGSLLLSNKAEVNAITLGVGNAGKVSVRASDTISLNDESALRSRVYKNAVGNSSGIDITTANLSVVDNSELSATTDGKGNAGQVIINASGSISLINEGYIGSRVAQHGKGNSGGINITANSLSLTKNSELNASTLGVGNAGPVVIQTSDRISLRDNSNIRSRVYEHAFGNSGGIDITTRNLSLVNNGGLSATTDGTGNAGRVTIRASGSISLKDSTFISSRVAEHGKGDSGGLYITADSLSLTNKGELNASTLGVGNAGKIIINVTDSISLSDESIIRSRVFEKAVGNSGGIEITTANLSVVDDSVLSATTDGKGNAGQVIINASGSISLMNEGYIGSRVAEHGKGNSGGIEITANSLSLTKNSELNASTLGVGNAGRVIIQTSDSISLRDNSTISSQVDKNAFGNSGGIDITTGSLSVVNGGGLSATTDGTGDAGRIIINASGSISLINEGYISSLVAEHGKGNSGGIEITANSLSLTNKADLNADTRGEGNAGNVSVRASDRISLDNSNVLSKVEKLGTGNSGDIHITTGSLFLSNGSHLSSETEGKGNAGNVIVNATDSIFLDASTVLSRVDNNAVGNAGGIDITTNSLSLINNAELNVSSFGQGNPGNLVIKADSIRLENQGKLTAETLSGEGGNIVLQVDDILFLRDNSLISARASGDAKGGNIAINAGFVIALPNQNNDIIANAQRGNGGNINVTTQAILGLEERSATPKNTTNDIDASSEFGLNGNVSINTPNVDPNQGLVNLPVEPAKVEVAQGCQAGGEQASIAFFNTGRGGLAPNPYEPLSSSEIWEDVSSPVQRSENSAGATSASASPATQPNKLVEAQGWIVNEKGEVTLVAQMPATRSQNRCRLR